MRQFKAGDDGFDEVPLCERTACPSSEIANSDYSALGSVAGIFEDVRTSLVTKDTLGVVIGLALSMNPPNQESPSSVTAVNYVARHLLWSWAN